MKKIIVFALAILPALTWAQGGPCIIKLNIDTVQARIAYLFHQVDEQYFVDSALVRNGKAEFHIDIPYALTARLCLDNRGFGYENGHRPDLLVFYLEKGTTQITTTDSVKNAVLTGSKLNTERAVYNKYIGPQIKLLEDLNAEMMLAPPERRKDTAFMNGVWAQMRTAVVSLHERQKEYIRQHPDAYPSVEALTDVGGTNINLPTVDPLYNSLSAKLRNTEAGKKLAASIETARRTGLGSMAPDFTQNDVNDRPVKLTDFRGKYVLLDFWASWCGPCRAENPNYVQAYNNYKDRNFTLLGVSLDQPGKKDAWLAAIKADGLGWTQVSDLKYWYNAVAKLYDIKSIPQNYLIGPDGKIIAKNLRGEELEKKLVELIGPAK